jgi:hypothetical protein
MQLMLDVWVLLAASGIIHSYRVFHIYADLGLVDPRVFYKFLQPHVHPGLHAEILAPQLEVTMERRASFQRQSGTTSSLVESL